MKQRQLTVTYKRVDELIPYVNNARMHSDEQVTQIASSIKEFGFNNPILTDGENGVIAGHGRLLAAKKLGLETVPTIELSGLTEAQKKAYILADNKLALDAGWDSDLLKIELEELKLSDIDLGLTGFNEQEIDTIINGWNSDIPDFDSEDPDPTHTKISLKVSILEEQRAKEIIENALDNAGIKYSYT